jgi:hypothetical protein
VHGDDAPADFVGDQNDAAGSCGSSVDQGAGFFEKAGNRSLRQASAWAAPAGKEQVGEPQGQAIDQNAGVRCRQFGAALRPGAGFPRRSPIRLAGVRGDGRCGGHFAVARFGGGQINDAQAGFRGAFFSQQALARTGAAKDQFFHGRHFR